jgi:glycosyltransferase involved in cell wall biosynthesis
MSEHEGFCLPLIESMVFDLPIIAYNSTAVPFTLEGAGVLINSKSLDMVGELVDRAAHEGELRRRIIEGQRARLERFRKLDLRGFLLEKIKELVP